MMAVVVILLNILIAQMSSTYSEAKKNARLQYDVDRMLIITRLEHSRFHKFVSLLIEVFAQFLSIPENFYSSALIHLRNFSFNFSFNVTGLVRILAFFAVLLFFCCFYYYLMEH